MSSSICPPYNNSQGRDLGRPENGRPYEVFIVSRLNLSSLAETLSGPRPGFCGLFLPVLRRRRGFESAEKPGRDRGNIVDRWVEHSLVRFGWPGKAADLSYELKRRSQNLLVGYRRLKVE